MTNTQRPFEKASTAHLKERIAAHGAIASKRLDPQWQGDVHSAINQMLDELELRGELQDGDL